MQLASKIVSYLFHPVFMPVVGIALMYYFNDEVYHGTPFDFFQRFIKLMLLISGVIVMMTLVMRAQGVIKTIEAEERGERLILYGMALAWYLAIYVLTVQNENVLSSIHLSVFSALLGANIALLLTFVITIFYKISAHMVGVSGLVGIFMGLAKSTFTGNAELIMILLFACGLVGTARMLQQAHSLQQVILGFVVGFLCTYFPVAESWLIRM